MEFNQKYRISNLDAISILDPVRIPKGLRFSWNAETVENIKNRNPDLRSAR
jgi:hypothetical protein